MHSGIRSGSRSAPGLILDRFVYSYLVYGETITLIDTGVAGCETHIFDTIRSAGRDPSEIALVILTHSHPDHIGAARAIREATGCSIAAHPAERAWIDDVELQNRERPVRGLHSLSVDQCILITNSWTGIVLIPMRSGMGRCRCSIHRATRQGLSRFSCRAKGRSSVATRYRYREICRSMTMLSHPCSPYSGSGGSPASGSFFQHGMNRRETGRPMDRWTGRLSISGEYMRPCVPGAGTGPIDMTDLTKKTAALSACPRRRLTPCSPARLQLTCRYGTGSKFPSGA